MESQNFYEPKDPDRVFWKHKSASLRQHSYCPTLQPTLLTIQEGIEMSEEVRTETDRNSVRPDKRKGRVLIYAAILAVVFLLGFIPTCMLARQRGFERDNAQAALRISNLQNSIGNAIVDARAGNYEVARQGMSDFFTNLGTEVGQGRKSIFNPTQEQQLRALLQERDDVITSLARSDAYSADRLTKLYNQYREAVAAPLVAR
jgi:hypothetical protein